MRNYLLVFAIAFVSLTRLLGQPAPVLLKNVAVIDGSGQRAHKNVNVPRTDGKIVSISKTAVESASRVIDLSGKSIMPLLTDVHGHLGMSKGTTIGPESFTREQIT